MIQSHLVRACAGVSHQSPRESDLAGCRSLSATALWPPPAHKSSHDHVCVPSSPPELCSATRFCPCRHGDSIASLRSISSALADSAVQLEQQRSGLSRTRRTATSLVEPRGEHWLSGLRHATAHSRATNPALQTGRLIGGLGGGAVAYAMSRDGGRAWAIPLGALLGSQVGCNAAAGRGPLPW